MIDLHTHFIYGVDDGANTLEESVEIIRQASLQGIKAMIATPHHIKASVENTPRDLEERLETIREALKDADIDMALYLGNELYYDFELLEDLESKQCLSLNNGRYILLELPFLSRVNQLEELIFELKLKGYQPILAHAERYDFVQKDIDALVEIIELGVLVQMNLGSLTGIYGETVKKTAELMVKRHMVHLVGTDVHKKNSKQLLIEEPLKFLQKHWRKDHYEKVINLNGQAVINDETIEIIGITKIKKKWPKRLLLGLLIFLVLSGSVLYYGYQKIENQFESAMIEQAKIYKAEKDAQEAAEKALVEKEAAEAKLAREAERAEEQVALETKRKLEDQRLAEEAAEAQRLLDLEEAEAQAALEAAKNEEERLLAEAAAEAARFERERQKKLAEKEAAELEEKRVDEEKRLVEEAAAEEARIEAERIEAERVAAEEKARIEAEIAAQYTNYDTDKAKAMDLALSKLSAAQVNNLIQMAGGGFNTEERAIAKKMFYNNFTASEQTWILEMYVKYYGS